MNIHKQLFKHMLVCFPTLGGYFRMKSLSHLRNFENTYILKLPAFLLVCGGPHWSKIGGMLTCNQVKKLTFSVFMSYFTLSVLNFGPKGTNRKGLHSGCSSASRLVDHQKKLYLQSDISVNSYIPKICLLLEIRKYV